MLKQKKFGTFGGVFTPSLLTILGVIMYMRLGSIVGNSSGIVMVIAIIFFSHIISITTGFSVSSISTDKKIKAGGIYYMLSRSLGFPIGGAIGITLFLATALSISLYLIGFAESMMPVIQNMLGIEVINLNHLRIIGSLALLMVFIIAFKSTSFALKIQYLILALIALSLLSVFTGSAEGLKKGVDEIPNANFAILFGIFFPAVTGFTAGVAMSGDLKNPSKSIPWGTMLAILVGLIVYISLAIFLNASIDKEILQSNNNALIQFGSITFLVIAGVWGATLSSALGGVLGGPRILQAMSLDKITPRIFGKGKGINNEPRFALILTFIISEIGILIGELNVIAEIVAMFYLAAYLFINVSCFLEQWASPDFRPKLKIPLWVSLVGAITTFLLMVQLNLAATLASVLIMILIFFWLTRKELVLGTGDVWLSVWSSVVKIGLKNLYKKSAHRRNWQPNILLFSGGTKVRPHLIELSKSITGRSGMVSNFDLIEESDAEILFPKHHQSVDDDDINDDTIFHRRLHCQNIFKGIESIANTYGFSGIDPNTILMGWARNTKDPKWFAQMTRKLHLLDYNILYLDYDKKKGFGNYQKIDIWWNDLNKESDLTLHLSKLILHSHDWNRAKIRIIYVNDDNSQKLAIEDLIHKKIEKLRIDLEYEVLNNEIEKKELYKLIKIYSNDTDLIIMSLPDVINGVENEYVRSTNSLLDVMGTSLILKASSRFKEEESIDHELEKTYQKSAEIPEKDTIDKIPLKESSVLILDKLISEIEGFAKENNETFSKVVFHSFSDNYINLSKLLIERLDELNVKDNHGVYLEISKYIEDFRDNRFSNIQHSFIDGINLYLQKLENIIDKFPSKINIPVLKEALIQNRSDDYSLIRLKSKYKKRLISDKPIKPIEVNIREIGIYHYNNGFLTELSHLIKSFGLSGFILNQSIRKILGEPKLNSLQKDLKKAINSLKQDLESKLLLEQNEFISKLNLLSNKWLNSVMSDSLKLNIRDVIINRQENYSHSKIKRVKEYIQQYPYVFNENQQLLLNQLITFIKLKGLKINLVPLLEHCQNKFSSTIINNTEAEFNLILNNIEKSNEDQFGDYKSEIANISSQFNIENEILEISEYIQDLKDDFSTYVEVLTPEGINVFEDTQTNLPKIRLNISKIVGHLLENEILGNIKRLLLISLDEVKQEIAATENNLELTVFTISNQTDKILVKQVLEKTKSQLNISIENISEIRSRFLLNTNKLILTIEDVFSDDVIIKNSKNQDLYSKKKKSIIRDSILMNKIVSFLGKYNKRIDKYILKVQDFYALSSYSNKNRALKSPIEKLINFSAKINPNKEVLSRLPFHYKQLFIGKHVSPKKPLLNRKKEYYKISQSISRFKEGKEGVIIVTGEPGSGKTYFINNVINCEQESSFFHLEPPVTAEKNFEKNIETSLAKVLNKKGKVEKLLKLIPDKSIIVIEDFEMWWLRNDSGFKQIEQFENLIKNNTKRILFIIECNIHFYSYIKNTSGIKNFFSNTIVLKPFSTQVIKEIINEKTKVGGLQYYWKNNSSLTMSSRRRNRLFSKINYLAEGNIGWANLNWLGGINEYEEDSLIIDDFNFSRLPDVLDPDWEVILAQVILHKVIHTKQLCELFPKEFSKSINEHISHLVRAEMLYLEHGFIQINPFLMPYVIRHLRKKKIIK